MRAWISIWRIMLGAFALAIAAYSYSFQYHYAATLPPLLMAALVALLILEL